MAAATGKFQAQELTIKVSGRKLVVKSKSSELLAKCGQNTARTFELETNGNLPQLKADLKKALADLEALDAGKKPGGEKA